MTSNSFYGTYLGNAGALAQGNPNPLADPRNKIPGAFPNSFPMLPGEDPGAIRGVYGTPGQGQPSMNTAPRLPLAQGFAGGIGNMAGMEGAQLAGGFNLLNPMTWGQAQEAVETSKKGIKQGSNKTPVNTILNRRAAEVEALRQQSLY